MSDTFSLACTDCGERLWVGQGWECEGIETMTLYSGDKYIKALKKFFFKHKQHRLIFDISDNLDMFEEME